MKFVLVFLIVSIQNIRFDINVRDAETGSETVTDSFIIIQNFESDEFKSDLENVLKVLNNSESGKNILIFSSPPHEHLSYLEIKKGEKIEGLSIDISVSEANDILNIFLKKKTQKDTHVKLIKPFE